jgi:hypothetical protein
MNLLPISDKLQALNLGVEGTSLFVDMMPSETVNGILLRNRLSGTPINWYLPGYLKGQFQVIVRAQTYDEGLALMNQVTSALTLYETSLGAIYIKYMRPKMLPVVFPLSNGENIEYSVYMDVCFTEAP